MHITPHSGNTMPGKKEINPMNFNRPIFIPRQRVIAGLVLAAIAAAIAIAGLLVGRPILELVSDPAAFRIWVADKGIWGKAAYASMVIVQIMIAFIPGEPLEIAGGYAFGALAGSLLCLAAGAAGSCIVIFLVRRFGQRLVNFFFSRERVRSLKFLQSSKKRTILFMLIFMIPGTPKDLLCYFAGLTDISFPVLALICTMGRIPSVVTSTIGGSALGQSSYIFAASVFAGTFALSIAGLAIYNAISKRHSQKTALHENKNI